MGCRLVLGFGETHLGLRLPMLLWAAGHLCWTVWAQVLPLLWLMLPGKMEPVRTGWCGFQALKLFCEFCLLSPVRLRVRPLCLEGGTPGEAEAGGRGGCSCLGWRLIPRQGSVMGPAQCPLVIQWELFSNPQFHPPPPKY